MMTGPIPFRWTRALRHAAAAAALAACSVSGSANDPLPTQVAPAPGAPRPPLAPLPVHEGFAAAVDRGTRTQTGEPGPNYWQQWATYRLEAELDPSTGRLSGRGTVWYHNRSPDTLRTLYAHVYPNLFAPGSRRNTDAPITDSVRFSRVAAGGETLPSVAATDRPGYRVEHTIMRITPPRPLAPRDSIELAFEWDYPIPPDGAPRGGQDGQVWYVSYWYPQMAVYDDVNGWQIDRYLGNAEFYMGYANYDVAITVPAGWLVGATGTLRNPEEVLTPQTRARLDSARTSTAVVRVVGETDRGAGRATAAGNGGRLTWRFTADTVRDFAWGASEHYLWDATHAVVGDATGDGRPDTVLVHAFYRPEQVKSAWDRSAQFGRHSVEFLSSYLWPYRYPHMTAMDGPSSCGGMEYPMMTCIGGQWDTLSMYEVTVHEIAHMWFPMMVGSDEKRFSWQDEGLTQFNQSQAMADYFRGFDDEARNREAYVSFARAGGEVELMRHGDRYPNYPSFGIASYYKMAAILDALRAVLGEETFNKAYREYGRRWLNRHPTPFDFWNTFEQVSGRDLDWFWRTWFYETWTLDQAIAGVTPTATGDSTTIVVVDRGRAPMPVLLAITRPGGEVERRTIPVDVWLSGARETTVTVPGAVARVEIDPERDFPDIDRRNQVWTAEPARATSR